jgi:hypothetical protein
MKRLLRFCAVAAMAALPAFGAGSGSAVQISRSSKRKAPRLRCTTKVSI